MLSKKLVGKYSNVSKLFDSKSDFSFSSCPDKAKIIQSVGGKRETEGTSDRSIVQLYTSFSLSCGDGVRLGKTESMNSLLRVKAIETTNQFRALNSVIQFVDDANALAVDVGNPLLEPWQLNLQMQPLAADYEKLTFPGITGFCKPFQIPDFF
ncbi:hypothetical protein SDJN02_24521, partial [Cucurbita argyrosperma subsp. argyrosperma]